MRDLIIIGAGPAGITASVYAARKMMDILVVSRDVGGQAALSGDVENYTGYQFITGPELALKFEEHMRRFNIPLKEGENVSSLYKQDDRIIIETGQNTYESRSVIIASGKRSRPLNVPGEEKFRNRGVSYCATCDGPLFARKKVAVIGGGNSALDAALQLINIAEHVYILNIGSEFSGEAVLKKKVLASPKVTVFHDAHVTDILGDKMVSGLRFKKGENQETLDLQGVFVEIGLVPNSEFVRGVDTNGSGEIKVDTRNRTSVPAIFAAGDVTDVPEKQIIIAAGEGAKAALSAFEYLVRTQ